MLRSNSQEENQDFDFTSLRERMVREQLEKRGIRDQRVLDAMRQVPREKFVGESWEASAYADSPLPIECEQTISQPYTVAFMCEAAQISPNDRVLEIGTGSGYGAAVLSLLCREVHTVERIPTLSTLAAERLQELGYANVNVHTANGTLGVPQQSPFDAIIVTAGGEALPSPYEEQLAEGGRVVIPLGTTPASQIMYRFTLTDGQLKSEQLGHFAFVPLIGEHGWNG